MRCRCGSTDIEHDASRGSAVCKVCGQVRATNILLPLWAHGAMAGGPPFAPAKALPERPAPRRALFRAPRCSLDIGITPLALRRCWRRTRSSRR